VREFSFPDPFLLNQLFMKSNLLRYTALKNKGIFIFLFAALFCLANSKKEKISEELDIDHEILLENLHQPWEIIWGPDNQIWMSERGGLISRVNPFTKKKVDILKIGEVIPRGEGGLLGMALHPEFNTSPFVFVAYNYNSRHGYREKIVRFRFDGRTLVEPVMLLSEIDAAGIHNGCRLTISRDKKLFISTGDAANTSLPQNTRNLNGKILRINLDGSIPADNPKPGNAIWSYGHRNPQGLVFVHNKLFSSEHGPNSDDEINIIEKDRNYGWPRVKGTCEGAERSFCTANDIMEPIKSWTPTIAVCGMDYYDSKAIPGWKNSLLLTTLKQSQLLQLKLNEDQSRILETNIYLDDKYGRLRDVCISNVGVVYVCTGNGNNDKIVMITQKNKN